MFGFTPELVRAGGTCIDAGANVGHHTFALFKLEPERAEHQVLQGT